MLKSCGNCINHIRQEMNLFYGFCDYYRKITCWDGGDQCSKFKEVEKKERDK